MREIILDTETTGLSWENGDRIVEIGCVELINHIPTGNTYQVYINPKKLMTKESSSITGLTDEFLKDKPLFSEIADDFLNFIGDGTLVIHNAPFDIGFLNSELDRLGKTKFNLEDAIDTLEIARRKFPGSLINLDALCRRFGIDTSSREKHGALIDCYLLAEVYIQLLGGKQSGLQFSDNEDIITNTKDPINKKQNREKRTFAPSEEELIAHREFLKTMESPIWNKVINKG
ncbi:MAG: DNA polymerase III subunit epsilon [Alphaproteobacteria bacterium]|nr:DNA polymerase III subunit epsilon [Alphaproteobacteria bacterium]